MTLAVEVTGYGICRAPTSQNRPYAVFIICVQQEQFQGWIIYRRYHSFVTLAEHLKSSLYSTGIIPSIPVCDENNHDVSRFSDSFISI